MHRTFAADIVAFLTHLVVVSKTTLIIAIVLDNFTNQHLNQLK